MNNHLLSIVAPCYNEAENIELFVNQLRETLKGVDYKLLLVNDGSTDQTQQMIDLAVATCPRVRTIRLSRNFGHQAAIKAGIDHAEGNCVVTMDCDLQHPPTYYLRNDCLVEGRI